MQKSSGVDFTGLLPLENAEVYRRIAETYPPGHPGRFAVARKNRLPEYPGTCFYHGETPFRTRTETCVACSRTKRALAREAGQRTYLDNCPDHGPQSTYQTVNGACLHCREENPRAKQPRPRAIARREGHATFMGACRTHGAVPHSVAHGKCLTCFTSGGLLRAAPKPASPRAMARNCGLKTYPDRCEVHGMAPFSVAHGKCLTCFTAGGIRRVRG